MANNDWDALIAQADNEVQKFIASKDSPGLSHFADADGVLSLYQDALDKLDRHYYDYNTPGREGQRNFGITKDQIKKEYEPARQRLLEAYDKAKKALVDAETLGSNQEKAVAILNSYGLLDNSLDKNALESRINATASRGDMSQIAEIQRAADHLNVRGSAYQDRARQIQNITSGIVKDQQRQDLSGESAAAEAASGLSYMQLTSTDPIDETNNATTMNVSAENLGNLLYKKGNEYYVRRSNGINKFAKYFENPKEMKNWPLLDEILAKEGKRLYPADQELFQEEKRALNEAKRQYDRLFDLVNDSKDRDIEFYKECLLAYYTQQPAWEDVGTIDEWQQLDTQKGTDQNVAQQGSKAEAAVGVQGLNEAEKSLQNNRIVQGLMKVSSLYNGPNF